MPTVIVEGPPLTIERKRALVASVTETVSEVYDWPMERIIVIIRENSDENVARGGVLRADACPTQGSGHQKHRGLHQEVRPDAEGQAGGDDDGGNGKVGRHDAEPVDTLGPLAGQSFAHQEVVGRPDAEHGQRMPVEPVCEALRERGGSVTPPRSSG